MLALERDQLKGISHAPMTPMIGTGTASSLSRAIRMRPLLARNSSRAIAHVPIVFAGSEPPSPTAGTSVLISRNLGRQTGGRQP